MTNTSKKLIHGAFRIPEDIMEGLQTRTDSTGLFLIVVIFVSILFGGNAGQGVAAGVSSSGDSIGAGDAGQSVDPNP